MSILDILTEFRFDCAIAGKYAKVKKQAKRNITPEILISLFVLKYSNNKKNYKLLEDSYRVMVAT